MNKTLRNFWLDMALYLLLVVNIALVKLTPQTSAGLHPGAGWHLHAFIGILLMLCSLVHIVWHWGWIRAVLTGRAKGRIKLFMICMVTVFMILAGFSGHEAMISISNLHSSVGSMALIGLFIHGVKHIRWLALTSRRLIATNESKQIMPSA